jgi:6-phosphofructokinase 1
VELGIDIRVTGKDIGYELRCADPIAFDIDYTRSLGEAAVEYLLKGGTNATITLQGDCVVPMPFEDMIDPQTGRTEVRMVNLESFTYRSAYKFMIRLKPEDAEHEQLWTKMAEKTHLSAADFKKRYGYLVGIAPRPF